ncbi:hypothetical protein BDA96_06G040800 [Sorghum bicolor]|uniref:Uncharacterized protein n=2 Tax=Sorghum bicolor TaxID=4558 RepID=A0A921QNC8_SORBI|nr:hypothetical protein BDA96_06G040800 [Sorghum bicolor]KXG25967.1 hypothetical protein SORBI_3006G037800 [Sorghum bicolor]
MTHARPGRWMRMQHASRRRSDGSRRRWTGRRFLLGQSGSQPLSSQPSGLLRRLGRPQRLLRWRLQLLPLYDTM